MRALSKSIFVTLIVLAQGCAPLEVSEQEEGDGAEAEALVDDAVASAKIVKVLDFSKDQDSAQFQLRGKSWVGYKLTKVSRPANYRSMALLFREIFEDAQQVKPEIRYYQASSIFSGGWDLIELGKFANFPEKAWEMVEPVANTSFMVVMKDKNGTTGRVQVGVVQVGECCR